MKQTIKLGLSFMIMFVLILSPVNALYKTFERDALFTKPMDQINIKEQTESTAGDIPLLGPLNDIIAPALTPQGTVVFYFVPSAIDETDGNITPTCDPSSGSTFPLGNSSVNCVALDSSGNSANASFTVQIIEPEVPVEIDPYAQAQMGMKYGDGYIQPTADGDGVYVAGPIRLGAQFDSVPPNILTGATSPEGAIYDYNIPTAHHQLLDTIIVDQV